MTGDEKRGEEVKDSSKSENSKTGVTKSSRSRQPSSGRFFVRSFALRTSMLFGLIAIMTALISILALSFVLNTRFNSYTLSNIQNNCDSAARTLSRAYSNLGTWEDMDIEGLLYSFFDTNIEFRVYDENGVLIYTSSQDITISDEEFEDVKRVSSDITVGKEKVGVVYIWVYGSETLMTERDVKFQQSSYNAIILSLIFAAILSVIIGIYFGRSIMGQVRKISRAANAIKNGNLSARSKLRGDDELSELGETFDAMAEAIQNDSEFERRLTSDVAHELRTPLMAMKATTEAMIDGVLPADEERLTLIDNEITRLGNLVDGILKLSRLENRATAFNKQEVNLSELISDVALANEMFMEDSDLTLEFSAEPDTIVMGDPDMLKQATANLLSNAVRYTPKGGNIKLRVDKDDIMGHIHVSDTGIGMSEEDMTHLFSRFWRADAGRDRASGGLGIGLSIVKEIVERHNGWIDVESELGKGSTFTIYIPLIVDDEEQKPKKKKTKQR